MLKKLVEILKKYKEQKEYEAYQKKIEDINLQIKEFHATQQVPIYIDTLSLIEQVWRMQNG